MLNLATETPPDWIASQREHLAHLLVEQAHLEKKAAAAAFGFMFRYPERVAIQRELSEVAREELEHFERTLDELARRGIPFVRQKPAPYAGELLRCVRGPAREKLLDQLLCNAAIEARSCERMTLLARGLRTVDPAAAAFYHELVGSEARHHGLYVDMARRMFEPGEVDVRLAEVMAHEAQVVATVPQEPGLHSGHAVCRSVMQGAPAE